MISLGSVYILVIFDLAFLPRRVKLMTHIFSF